MPVLKSGAYFPPKEGPRLYQPWTLHLRHATHIQARDLGKTLRRAQPADEVRLDGGSACLRDRLAGALRSTGLRVSVYGRPGERRCTDGLCPACSTWPDVDPVAAVLGDGP